MQNINNEYNEKYLNHYKELHSYLITKMELIEPEIEHPQKGPKKATEVKITTSNTAPYATDGPTIIFTDVVLCVGHIGGNIQTIKPHIIKQEKEENSDTLPDIKYICITGINNSNPTVSHNQNGETLLPGQSVTFEMFVPSQMIPYLQFRVEGNISWQHLYNCQNTITIPEKFTKPIFIEALKDYNILSIHEILETTLKYMPALNGETRLADVQTFSSLISLKLLDIRKIQGLLNELYKKHNIFWFHLLLKTTHIYLEHLKNVLQEVKNALSSDNQDKTLDSINTLKSLRNEADDLNKRIEHIIEKNKLSDEEVSYKIRTNLN